MVSQYRRQGWAGLVKSANRAGRTKYVVICFRLAILYSIGGLNAETFPGVAFGAYCSPSLRFRTGDSPTTSPKWTYLGVFSCSINWFYQLQLSVGVRRM